MKTILFALALTFATSAHAKSKTYEAELTGTLKFNKTSTVTCAAIGCPPSQPYFEGILVLENGEEITLPNLKSEYGISEKPACLPHNDQCLAEGTTATINADITEFDTIGYKYVSEIRSIRAH